MGSFPGHANSGISFLLLATFWTLQRTFNTVYVNYETSDRRRDKTIQRFKKIPLEGIVILLAGIGGIIGEQVYGEWKWRLFDDQGAVVYPDNWQHSTMYGVFAIYGVAKIVGSFNKDAEKWYKVFLTFAYFIEGMLFYFHLHGRTELNIRLHTLEVLAVFLCVLFSAGEIWLTSDNVLPWLRTWATFLQGSWMVQIGSTLYHPLRSKDYSWDEEDHLNVQFFSIVFAWHCILGIIILLIQVVVTKFIMRFIFGAPSMYFGLPNNEDIHLNVTGTNRRKDDIFEDDI